MFNDVTVSCQSGHLKNSVGKGKKHVNIMS